MVMALFIAGGLLNESVGVNKCFTGIGKGRAIRCGGGNRGVWAVYAGAEKGLSRAARNCVGVRR